MLKLIPAALLAASFGLIGITASVQTASAQPVLLTLKLPLPSAPTALPPTPVSLPLPPAPTAPISLPLPPAPTAPISALPSTSVSITPVTTAATATVSGVVGADRVEGKAAESTVSTIGTLAGASTDSHTGVGLNLPTNPEQVEASVEALVEKPLDRSGTASVVVSGNRDRIDGDAGVDLTVKAGDLAVGRICLDGDASIGSAGDKSLADCKADHPKPKPQSVPEPSVAGSLAVLGAYFVARHRRSKTAITR